MEGLWEIMRGWSPIGQGFFLLLVIGGIFALFKHLAYYISVGCRGWPPEHVNQPSDDEDSDLI